MKLALNASDSAQGWRSHWLPVDIRSVTLLHAGKHHLTALICALLILGGSASVAAALLWHSSVGAREAQSFQTAAADVSGRLEILIRRDTDFVRTVGAIFAMQPEISPTAFAQWSSLIEGHEFQPGTYGSLIVKSLRRSQVAAFLARRNANPTFRALTAGHIEPVPTTEPGPYCLLAAGTTTISVSPIFDAALQGNWCDPRSFIGGFQQSGTTRAQFTREITEAGSYAVYSVPNAPGTGMLAIETPVYRRGAPQSTPVDRRAAALGWVLGIFDIRSLLTQALGTHRHIAIALSHQNAGLRSEPIGSVGSAGGGAYSHRATLPLDGTWIISVKGASPVAGPSANLQAAVVLLAGLLASLLLSALVFVLARSRQRALNMVREKTVQLEHQALHDSLTGLPNRVLALDRAAQMLARARRARRPMAALYLDIDGFKDVNDSLGHAAGDALLRAVAERIQGAVREGETAARLGGDEFVILIESSAAETRPERLAERLIEELESVSAEILRDERAIAITLSVGIACGIHDNVDDLLREADIALYAAKAAGKSRYIIYRDGMRMADSPMNGRASQCAPLGALPTPKIH